MNELFRLGCKQKFPQYLRLNDGHITKTCKVVGIDRSTYYEWYNNDPDFAQACDDTVMLLHDEFEGALHEKIREKDIQAIIFFCRKKLAYRGYGDDPIKYVDMNGLRKAKSVGQLSDADKSLLDRYVQDHVKYVGNNLSDAEPHDKPVMNHEDQSTVNVSE